jgi:predicted alpha/beta-fold hydrolase
MRQNPHLAALDMERLLTVSRATRPLGLPDGGLAYASNAVGHSQAYRVSGPGDEPKRLVDTDDRVIPHVWTRHGLVVRHDNGGDETWQLSLIGDDGRMRQLSFDPEAIHADPRLRPDGDALGLSWNPGGQGDMVIGELLLPSGELHPWLEPGGYWNWDAWSPDGDRAVVVQTFGSWDEAHLLDRTGRLVRLLPNSRVAYEAAWTGAGLFLLTDGGDDFVGLAEIDPARPMHVKRWLLHPQNDITGLAVSPDGMSAVVVVNAGIFDQLVILDLLSGREIDRAEFPPGVVVTDHSGESGYHVGWSADGTTVFAAWDTPTRPADILAHPGGRRWTMINPEASASLVSPVETGYGSFDGLQIPAIHFRVDDTARPTVCIFHGGPEGQARGEYRPLYHLLNAAGMNVLAPNVRGSSGYGFHYQSLDDVTLRWDSVKDGCEAARWLKSTGQATKVAAAGGSYGGFMTLAVIVEDPGLWDAAVDTVGIARWRTFFENMPPWRGVLRMREYGNPLGAEAEFLESISPINRASTIRTPLLVVHGRNDPRVPVEESIQIATAAGAELLIFDDEGHGIARHANQVVYHRRILEFLVRWLG